MFTVGKLICTLLYLSEVGVLHEEGEAGVGDLGVHHALQVDVVGPDAGVDIANHPGGDAPKTKEKKGHFMASISDTS